MFKFTFQFFHEAAEGKGVSQGMKKTQITVYAHDAEAASEKCLARAAKRNLGNGQIIHTRQNFR